VRNTKSSGPGPRQGLGVEQGPQNGQKVSSNGSGEPTDLQYAMPNTGQPGARRTNSRARAALTGLVARNTGAPLVLSLVVVFIFFELQSTLFLSARNMSEFITELAPLAFIALGSALMIIVGEIDLSLGSIAGMTAALGARLLVDYGLSVAEVIAAMIVVGGAIGALYAAIVVLGHVRSFVVTLAGYLAWYGVQLWLLGSGGELDITAKGILGFTTITVPTAVLISLVCIGGIAWIWALLKPIGIRGSWGTRRVSAVVFRLAVLAVTIAVIRYFAAGGGVPIIVVLVIAITAAAAGILKHTAGGRHMYAIGGDVKAAADNGVRVGLVKTVAFICTGALSACAGLALLSYTAGVDSSTGGGTLLLEGIGAVVVGGISLRGGRGSVWGALGGALLLQAIQNGLDLLNVSSYMVYIIEGLVVVLALLFDSLVRQRLTAER
jgi:D-xylose transport system permease protein